MINGSRVKQAREFCGLTQSVLADIVQVSQSTIAYIEMGRFEPSDELLGKIALATGFPPPFFSQGNPPDFPEGSLLFRARTSMPSTLRSQAFRYGEVLFEMAERMASKLRVIPPRLPQFAEESVDIVTAAHFTRNVMGISPGAPITNLIHAAERAGVLVLAAPFSHPELDAYSAWAGTETRRPVVVVFGNVSGDRLRYTIAHELGHLVLHQAVRGQWHAFNTEANRFAAELLLPAEAMREELISPITLTGIASLKLRWGVSIQALIHRAHDDDLSLITDRQYRYLFEQLSLKGWRKHEPIEVPVEKPRAVRKMAELLFPTPDKKDIDYQKIAAEYCLSVVRVRQILERHAGRPGNGGGDVISDSEREHTVPLQFPRKLS